MSTYNCNISFDNKELREVFLELIPNIAPDVSSFLQTGMQLKGVTAEPSISVSNGEVEIRLLNRNKGTVAIVDPEGDGVVFANYLEVKVDEVYAALNPRTKVLDVFHKQEDVDTVLGRFNTFSDLWDGLKDVKIPEAPKLEEYSTPMEVVPSEAEPVEEAEVVDPSVVTE